MSLYDKYHSKHNKDYMYNLISSIIQKEHNVIITQNEMYNQFYETNFKNTFKLVDTEELTILNKHLLDKQVEYFTNFISKQTNYKKEEKVEDIELEDNIIIHSLNRNINLKNSSRHNFRIKNLVKGKECRLDKVVVPIEDKPLFMNPIIVLSLDTKYIELHLRGTIKLRNREYGIYSPFYEDSFTLSSDIIRIQLKNQLYSIDNYCDVYKVLSYKDNILTILSNKDEFKQGDFIRLCNFETIELEDETCLKQQYKIENVTQNKDTVNLTIGNCKEIVNGLYIMNMSLQNSIHINF